MISVGVDVSKGKSTVCILKPYGEVMMSPSDYEHTQRTIGMRIKKQRRMLGLTQKKLGELIYLPKATISAYENDNIELKVGRIEELARALCTTPNYLLGFDGGEKDEIKKMDETMIALLGMVKDEKVKRILLAQIRVTLEIAGE